MQSIQLYGVKEFKAARFCRRDIIGKPRMISLLSCFNSLIIKKQTTKANFQNMLSPSYIILRIQRLEGKQCRSRRGGSI